MENHENSWKFTFLDYVKTLIKHNENEWNLQLFSEKLKNISNSVFCKPVKKPYKTKAKWGPCSWLFAKFQKTLDFRFPKTSPSPIDIWTKSSPDFGERIFKFFTIFTKKCSPGTRKLLWDLGICNVSCKVEKSCEKLEKLEIWKFSILGHFGMLSSHIYIYIYAKSRFDLPWNFIENHEIFKNLDFWRKAHLMPPTCHFPYKNQYIRQEFWVQKWKTMKIHENSLFWTMLKPL